MRSLQYILRDIIELNLSYIPFVKHGGIFIPTRESFVLTDEVEVELQILPKSDTIIIPGKVIWITPVNALNSVVAGIGIQFKSEQAEAIRLKLESYMDKAIERGGYTCGITD